ncbi:MAG: PAS domain S-box protein [Betaproteobacteria bacterium]|nr:PAS domain S-box protein [Betaproteobacteria bacterium]
MSRPLRIALVYAALGLAWIAFSDLALGLLVTDAGEIAWLGAVKGFAFVGVTALVLYAMLARGAAAPPPASATPVDGRLPLALLVAGILAGVVLLVSTYRADERAAEEIDRQLTAMAGSKSSQVELFLAARMRLAAALAASVNTAELPAHGRAPSGDMGSLPWAWLDRASAEAGFEGGAVFVPGESAALVRTGVFPPSAPPATAACTLAIERGRAAHSDLLHEDGRDALYFAAPVSRADGRTIALCLVFRSDPARDLYPLITDSPIETRSGETILTSAAGSSITFYGTLRHRPAGTGPLVLASRADLPAAMAARGRVGVVQGNDYRGEPVQAVLRPVRGTPWTVIAKIDRQEVASLAGASTRLATYGAMLVFAASLLGGVLAWRAQAATAAARERAALAERDQAQRRERDWASLFFSMPFTGMAVTSARSRKWVRFNDRLCQILGYPREELEQLAWTAITHPDDLDKDVAQFRRVLAGEIEGYRLDKRFLHKDGHVIHAVIDVRAIREPDGSVEHFIATVEDTTERVQHLGNLARLRDLYDLLSQTNQAIVRCRSREELFANIVRHAVERGRMRFAWIGLLDERNVLQPVARFGDDRGYVDEVRVRSEGGDPLSRGPSGQAIRAGRHMIANDFAADPALAPWQAAAARAGVGASAAFPIRLADRVVGALNLYAAEKGYFDEDVVRTLDEMALDISFALDHLAARKDLEAAMRLVQDIVDATDAVVSIFDREGRCVLGNRAYAQVIGQPLERIAGSRREDLMPADIAGVLRDNDLEVLASGEPMRFQETHAGTDGRHLYQSAKFPVRDAGGAVSGVGSISVDVTELVRARERLADANRVLEDRVAERTRELTIARDRALAADRVKSLFLATVSHELRTPLNSIIGFTGVLLAGLPGPLNAEQSKQLSIVQASSKHLLQLINDVLDLSKIEAGEFQVAREDFAMHALVQDCLEAFTPDAALRGLALALDRTPGEPRVRADPRRVRQVLDNLVANALKFTDRGAVTVITSREAGQLRVTVADTGIGIPVAGRDSLFRPFSRLDPDPAREGTGLGLAIVRRLVMAMGGELGFDSRVGEGSRFWFTLPSAGPAGTPLPSTAMGDNPATIPEG